jgi:hypothetical protein
MSLAGHVDHVGQLKQTTKEKKMNYKTCSKIDMVMKVIQILHSLLWIINTIFHKGQICEFHTLNTFFLKAENISADEDEEKNIWDPLKAITIAASASFSKSAQLRGKTPQKPDLEHETKNYN